MATKRRANRRPTTEYGKTRTTTTLKGLTISIGGVEFVQQELSVKALVTYAWDIGVEATADDPGFLPTFEVTKVLPSRMITFVDEKHSLNIRCWKAVDVLPYLTEKCLQAIDKKVEQEVRYGATIE